MSFFGDVWGGIQSAWKGFKSVLRAGGNAIDGLDGRGGIGIGSVSVGVSRSFGGGGRRGGDGSPGDADTANVSRAHRDALTVNGLESSSAVWATVVAETKAMAATGDWEESQAVQPGERLPTTFEDGSPLPGPVIDALKPYFEGFELTQIRIHNGIPGYVVGEPAAYTSKNDIYIAKGFYDPNTARGISLIAHEARHSQQYQELGTFGFRARYLAEYTGGRLRLLGHEDAYRNISLEREAFTLQRRVYFDLIDAGYPR